MSTLLAVAAWMLGLSLLVQVVQETWKFFTNSKAKAFEGALIDLLGPSLVARLQQDRRLAVRGPMQFRRVTRAGHVLPSAQHELMHALENTAPRWHLGLLRALQAQCRIAGTAVSPPSLKLNEALREIDAAAHPGAPEPYELSQFLRALGVRPGEPLNADRVLKEYWSQYFGHLQPLVQHYPQLIRNFEYAYQRKNLKSSFVIGFALAMFFNLPFDSVYRRASMASPTEALRMATDAQAAFARSQDGGQEDLQRLQALTKDALSVACGPAIGSSQSVSSCYQIDYAPNWQQLAYYRSEPWEGLRYLFGCMLTALLVSFGAPFWNDLLTSLGRGKTAAKSTANAAASE